MIIDDVMIDKITLHGLGFVQVQLLSNQRLQVWHPELPRRACFEHSSIHNHRLDFKSRVLDSPLPFDQGLDSDFDNCDLYWKKSEGKLIRTIMDDPSRVIWWSSAEGRFGQVFRQYRADYKSMGWSAEQRSRQTDFDFDYLAEDIDCFCGD